MSKNDGKNFENDDFITPREHTTSQVPDTDENSLRI